MMPQPVHELLAPWESFYIIAGSVAGALIGLQFVVITLIADSRSRPTGPEIAAFGTPTVLHFSAALLVSALLSVPWTSLIGLQSALVACGVAGVFYVGVVIRRARRTQEYRPQAEDWIWHAVLPLWGYLTLVVGAAIFPIDSGAALALIGAVSLGLVFIGIHNAWDAVTYVVSNPDHAAEPPKKGGRKPKR
jgi:hypothetical protein